MSFLDGAPWQANILMGGWRPGDAGDAGGVNAGEIERRDFALVAHEVPHFEL